jgi:hypothetical protein
MPAQSTGDDDETPGTTGIDFCRREFLRFLAATPEM